MSCRSSPEWASSELGAAVPDPSISDRDSTPSTSPSASGQGRDLLCILISASHPLLVGDPQRQDTSFTFSARLSSHRKGQTPLGNGHHEAFKRLGQIPLESRGIFFFHRSQVLKIKPTKIFSWEAFCSTSTSQGKDDCTAKTHQRLGAHRVPTPGSLGATPHLNSL